MGSSNIRDVLTSFSPSLDLFAITLGDGRIKIWDTGKGQLQTEFADISSTETTSIFGNREGHLSMDYTCMKWLSLERKKKRKLGSSLLVLGTGGGDVLALDVSAGQLKWRVNNCHPGGVTAVSFSVHGSHIYTAGADGMVCEIDSMSGNVLNKLTASSRVISSLAVSPDGKMIATAAGQVKIFNSSNQKKLQKFSGHPGAVRCMVFSEDGRYVLSSSLVERYVAVWKIDGSKKKSSSVFLAMDHPAVFLDSRCTSSGDADAGLSVLAISEIGICYFWHGKTIDELRNSKPTKISVPCDGGVLKKHKGAVPNVFAAKLQNISEPACGHMYLAFGLLIKPTFEKVLVHSGTDIELNFSEDGILRPISQSHIYERASETRSKVTALDRTNTEGALLPVPKIFDPVDNKSGTKPSGGTDEGELDSVTLCMEDQLRSLGILGSNDLSTTLDSEILDGIKLDSSMPHKKVKATVSSMEPNDAFNLLKGLVDVWESRSQSAKHVLPWICCILVYHSDYVKSQEPKLLDSLYKVAKSKVPAMNSLFQLSGRLQLVSAQIDKATNNRRQVLERDVQEDESEDEDVDEVLYGVDEDSPTE
ncbi:WD repeat-containing protein 43 [Sesamum indicum]|uniref:WD repeat-containing protein 43 n=1 Tax=Sesamum indicum TaxID=4182 RepID=A0A6I9TVG3_SESIN|nr:WD repeat-containing protein 43 [Sesamum indicum]XP_011091026.1 WD repeat-containing protein 43 [Sesamum indicum]XP_011091028.1 WD repeat-containing protein 43 [Sesamum indicum]